MPVCLCACLFAFLPACLSVCLCLGLPVCLSVCLCLSVSVCLSVQLAKTTQVTFMPCPPEWQPIGPLAKQRQLFCAADDFHCHLARVLQGRGFVRAAVISALCIMGKRFSMMQERERRKQHATQRAVEAEELQRAKSMVRRQSMVSISFCHVNVAFSLVMLAVKYPERVWAFKLSNRGQV